MRIYFCSDVHASRKCWKKFLASAKFYNADMIIVGGDITGKFIVPIVQQPGGKHTAKFLGVERRGDTAEGMQQLKIRIADTRPYYCEMTPEEQAWDAEGQARGGGLVHRPVLERGGEWLNEGGEKRR